MAKKLKAGDRVAWDTPQGTTRGKVVRELNRATKIKGHTAKPSAKSPQYLVKSVKSGKTAAHKPRELRKS